MRDVRDGYGRIARRYAGDEPAEDDPEMRALTRAHFLERLKGKRVLEVGCGPGTDAAAFAEAGLDIVATDITPEFIHIVRERYPQLRAEVMDLRAPDPELGLFDGIYGFATFLHVPRDDAAKAVAALWERLRPGGLLYLGLIESTQVDEYEVEGFGDPDVKMPFVCWSPEELSGLLEEAGFAEVEILRVPSLLYESLPRLLERGVRAYQVAARRPTR
jgi:SAM-dependent methyltransferase